MTVNKPVALALVDLHKRGITAAAAERNAEIVIAVANVPSLAGQYVAKCTRLWNEGKDLSPRY